jgi:hypothetical protein
MLIVLPDDGFVEGLIVATVIPSTIKSAFVSEFAL